MKQPNDFKHYIGDCSLEYGGLFVNLEDFRDGYAECLQITDLDSACGFNNTVMVERITVLFDTAERVKDALACCGLTFEDLRKMPIESRKMAIVDACASYGHYDLVSDYGGLIYIFHINPKYQFIFVRIKKETVTFLSHCHLPP